MGNKEELQGEALQRRQAALAAAAMSSFLVEDSAGTVPLPNQVASIGGVLGRGSDAVVFEAVAKESGAAVAVKAIHLPVGWTVDEVPQNESGGSD